MIVRTDKMRASKTIQDRVLSSPESPFTGTTEPVDVVGNDRHMTGVKVKILKPGKVHHLMQRGLF
jgi:thioredoxin reductase (NADPH)